jgi:hypothetical protein
MSASDLENALVPFTDQTWESKLLKAINGLDIKPYYQNPYAKLPHKSLTEAFSYWDYEWKGQDKNGYEKLFYSCEKLDHHADMFWKAIAEFIEDGSYIECSGEEGEVWRWVFDGGDMETKKPNWS